MPPKNSVFSTKSHPQAALAKQCEDLSSSRPRSTTEIKEVTESTIDTMQSSVVQMKEDNIPSKEAVEKKELLQGSFLS